MVKPGCGVENSASVCQQKLSQVLIQGTGAFWAGVAVIEGSPAGQLSHHPHQARVAATRWGPLTKCTHLRSYSGWQVGEAEDPGAAATTAAARRGSAALAAYGPGAVGDLLCMAGAFCHFRLSIPTGSLPREWRTPEGTHTRCP